MPTPVSWPLWVPTEAAGNAVGVATCVGTAEVFSVAALKIESVYTLYRTTVQVIFNRPVKMTADVTGALYLANYSLEGATIESIEQVGNQEVWLTTSPLDVGTRYTLSVDNVEDSLGNPISPS